ncbi:hypothetical protein OIU84_009193 [Salix udensis]|uniref:Pentatricopeptide repeat-containing protein n=1 Tax=Salix udensis TaxID=889485 RepID=A0AAD6NYG9_9ROSI|nr:hypothetical protein OIU84_009193 [Salix udensis]
MIASGISLNVFSYNILIRGFCAAGNLEMGLRFFEEMDRNGCLPNVVTYNTVIGAYCKLKRIDEAFKLLRSMGLKGLEPNLLTYNMVINGLCREGRIEETSGVLEEMGRKGFAPDEVTYNTLVNGYCKVGNFHQALVLHSEMLRNGLSPDVVTYTSLINTMCKAGNLNRAMGIFDQMHVREMEMFRRHINSTKEMIDFGFIPHTVTIIALVKALYSEGMDKQLNLVIRNILRSCKLSDAELSKFCCLNNACHVYCGYRGFCPSSLYVICVNRAAYRGHFGSS